MNQEHTLRNLVDAMEDIDWATAEGFHRAVKVIERLDFVRSGDLDQPIQKLVDKINDDKWYLYNQRYCGKKTASLIYQGAKKLGIELPDHRRALNPSLNLMLDRIDRAQDELQFLRAEVMRLQEIVHCVPTEHTRDEVRQ